MRTAAALEFIPPTMHNHPVLNFFGEPVSASDRILVSDTYCGYGISCILTAERTLHFVWHSGKIVTDRIISSGFNLLTKDKVDSSPPMNRVVISRGGLLPTSEGVENPDASSKASVGFRRGPNGMIIPLADYRGEVNVSLKGSNHPLWSFTVKV